MASGNSRPLLVHQAAGLAASKEYWNTICTMGGESRVVAKPAAFVYWKSNAKVE